MQIPRLRAYLCFGPNCAPKGSGSLLDYLSAEVERHDLQDQVSVAATGCQAHCESGPTMVVFPGPTFYQAIDPTRLARIVEEHFVAGQPVKEYFWTGVRRRIVPGAKPDPRPLPLPVQASNTEGRSSRQNPNPKPKRPPPDVDDFKW